MPKPAAKQVNRPRPSPKAAARRPVAKPSKVQAKASPVKPARPAKVAAAKKQPTAAVKRSPKPARRAVAAKPVLSARKPSTPKRVTTLEPVRSKAAAGPKQKAATPREAKAAKPVPAAKSAVPKAAPVVKLAAPARVSAPAKPAVVAKLPPVSPPAPVAAKPPIVAKPPVTVPAKPATPPAKVSPPPSDPPRRKPSGLTARDVQHLADLLLEKRRELVGDMSSMEREALRSGVGSHASMPVQTSDMGTDSYEQEFTLGLVEKERTLLREIHAALAKMPAGTYGICEGTGMAISRARLEVQPWARYSIEFARQREKTAMGIRSVG